MLIKKPRKRDMWGGSEEVGRSTPPSTDIHEGIFKSYRLTTLWMGMDRGRGARLPRGGEKGKGCVKTRDNKK